MANKRTHLMILGIWAALLTLGIVILQGRMIPVRRAVTDPPPEGPPTTRVGYPGDEPASRPAPSPSPHSRPAGPVDRSRLAGDVVRNRQPSGIDGPDGRAGP